MSVWLAQNTTTVTQAIVYVAYWLSVIFFTLAIDHWKTTILCQQMASAVHVLHFGYHEGHFLKEFLVLES